MSEYVVVLVEDNMDGDELSKQLKNIEGVKAVELDGDCASDLLREVGEALWKLENHNRLDCPLHALRQRIEKLLDEDLRVGHKDIQSMLGEVDFYQI